jgi:hypothetical protein
MLSARALRVAIGIKLELDTGDLLYTRSTKTIPPKTITNHTIERLSQKECLSMVENV